MVLTKANQKKKLQKLKIKFPKKHLKPQFTFVSNAAGFPQTAEGGFHPGFNKPPHLLQNTITILLVSVTIAGKDRARDLSEKIVETEIPEENPTDWIKR